MCAAGGVAEVSRTARCLQRRGESMVVTVLSVEADAFMRSYQIQHDAEKQVYRCVFAVNRVGYTPYDVDFDIGEHEFDAFGSPPSVGDPMGAGETSDNPTSDHGHRGSSIGSGH